MMTLPHFVHLHVRSDYSMIDGMSKVHKLVEKAIFLKMPALALTDFNNIFGLIKFYNYSCKLGLKPIIGSDLLVQDIHCDDIKYSELTCLVSNDTGYKHLIKLLSQSYKYKSNNDVFPVVKRQWLMEYNAGLILISGGRNGDVGKHLLKNNKHRLEQCLYFYHKFFPNRYYIELIRTNRINEESYVKLAIELSRTKGLPVVASNDVRFINKEDFQAHEIRVAIHDGVMVKQINQLQKYSPEQFMKSEEEMCTLFADIPESLTNSVEIAKRCNCMIDLGGPFLPKFPTGSMSVENCLVMHAQQGLEERLMCLFPKTAERHIKRAAYDERLKYELKVINQMGFPSYFLIVMEFIQWAKNNNIPVGPGRGSGASSLVAYALKITELDPIKFDLLFERFLNLERISMPDLDIDFCMEQRDLVIDHVSKTYGSHAVSQIITFGTMAAKAVVRDVGRVLGYSYSFVNNIAKLIPFSPGITLDKACTLSFQLKSMYDNNEEVKTLIELSKQLEGIIKNVSKHAGGVVISPGQITNFSPLYYDNNYDHPMTQFDKDDIECIGLIKFDFLGLRTLTTINRALKMINAQNTFLALPIININTISLKDKKSFQELQTSETTAIFQLESRGIRALIKRLKPDCFEDLIALIALFRPGPLQSGMVDNFINRKHGREIIAYPDSNWEHESLRPVLKSTYGVILYQEQVMQIAQVLAGYTLGKADILRRAIGKKNSEDMAKQRSIFNAGAARRGINQELSEKIFDLMEKFAGYGFNKSHSVAYAMISYQTLWLKTHYPSEFMASTLSSDMDNLNKVINLLHECCRMGLKVLSPNINNGKYHFYVNENKEIVYGMGAIKGIGKASIDIIVTNRNLNGNFKNLFDFCIRVSNAKINHRVIEKLIFSGAFDVFGIHRLKLINSLNNIMKSAAEYINQKNNKQIDIFKINSNSYLNQYNIPLCDITTVTWNDQVLLEKEKEVLGLYFTHHPVDKYVYEIKQYISNIISIKDVLCKRKSKIVYIFGLFISIRVKISKKGTKIVFGMLEDGSGQVEIIVFSNLLKKYHHYLKENNMILVKGLVTYNEVYDIYKIIAQEFQNINDIRKRYIRNVSIILHKDQVNTKLLKDIQSILIKNKDGNLPIRFIYKTNTAQIKLNCNNSWYITLTDQLLIDLRNLIGYDCVRLEVF